MFRHLVLAGMIEPTSKLDSVRVLAETGVAPVSYRTLKRRVPAYATEAWRERLAVLRACHVGLGPATLLLYDVTTLYFETDTGDRFRESGFSKERRLEPQITVGTLTNTAGFPLMVNAFEGNKAETTTMLPAIKAFMAAHPSTRHIEQRFRMAKSDLAARPIYHRTKDSIEAHLTIVLAALAVSRWIEDTTDWSVKKFVKTVRRYHTIHIQAGDHVITAADPLPDDIHQIIKAIKTRAAAH